MPGTKAGSKRAAKTMMKRYGKDYFSRIGSKAGMMIETKPKGFAHMAAHDPERLRGISMKGQKALRRNIRKRNWENLRERSLGESKI